MEHMNLFKDYTFASTYLVLPEDSVFILEQKH